MNTLREKIAACLFESGIETVASTYLELADAILAIPELQEALRDAERYRWLRQYDAAGRLPYRSPEELDAAIDAARGEEK